MKPILFIVNVNPELVLSIIFPEVSLEVTVKELVVAKDLGFL
jgi:hypothetical protein